MYNTNLYDFTLCVPLDFLFNWLMSFFSGIRPNWQRVAGDSAAQRGRPARKLRQSAGRRQQTTAIKSAGRHSSSSKVFKKSRPSFQWICDMTSRKMLIVDIASSNHFPRPDTYFIRSRELEPGQHGPSHKKRKINRLPSPFRASWTYRMDFEERSAWSFLVDLQRISDNDTPEMTGWGIEKSQQQQQQQHRIDEPLKSDTR